MKCPGSGFDNDLIRRGRNGVFRMSVEEMGQRPHERSRIADLSTINTHAHDAAGEKRFISVKYDASLQLRECDAPGERDGQHYRPGRQMAQTGRRRLPDADPQRHIQSPGQKRREKPEPDQP